MRASTVIATATALLLGAGLLSACGDDDGDDGDPAASDPGLTVELNADSFPAGAMIAATVINNTDEDFTYGAPYALEVEVEGEFEPVDLGDLAFIEIAYVAKAGGVGPLVAVDVPDDAEPGTWRVLLSPDFPGTENLTAEFEVIGG
jgi:hypothetical protein